MKIDELFKDSEDSNVKENYYIGRVTQIFSDSIYIQFENLNTSSSRIFLGDYLRPGKVGEYVVIDDFPCPLIGKIEQIKLKDSDNVHQSLKNADDETIYPTGKIQIIGTVNIIDDEVKVEFDGFKVPELAQKVYVCSNKIVKAIDATLYRKKPKENDSISFCNFHDGDKFQIAVDDLYQQHLMIVGSTNSGKSTSALSIIDKSLKRGVKYLILDPTGEYSESFNLCENIDKYTLGEDLHVENGYIRITQWCDMIGTNKEAQPAELNKAIEWLKLQHQEGKNEAYKYINKGISDIKKRNLKNKSENFDISLLSSQIFEQSVSIGRYSKVYEYNSFKQGPNEYLIDKINLLISDNEFMKIFNFTGNEIESKSLQSVLKEFYFNENSLYINCSKINNISVMSVFISILIDIVFSNSLEFEERKPFVFYLDEAHRYMRNEVSKEALIRIAREGRKYGIFMNLTTQSPNDVPDILLSQIGTFIIHRLSHNSDIQTMLGFTKENVGLQYLKQGEAILTSVHLTQDVKIDVNKSKLTHKNSTPSLLNK
ncbi:ATP-binding protein [Ligilactobacillus sp. 110_WCHN]|uniref:ATP-binding protein n=1 Tax=Ligilactobacillus sp. 110_WCHN TaxID=3057125 RepID=UPI002670F977|nr:ATP-binding protein [Ligilactobacillus sp. 110_WCHN]MDO3392645.1 ATP-binding protein [Ligilactobacillus sp. 110_WCHN]